MPEGSLGVSIVGVLVSFPFAGTTPGSRNRLIADADRFPGRRGDPCGRPPQATESDRGPPRCSDAKSRRWAGCGSVRTEEGTHKGCPYGIPIRRRTQFPVSPQLAARTTHARESDCPLLQFRVHVRQGHGDGWFAESVEVDCFAQEPARQKLIYCESVESVHISPISRRIEQLCTSKS